MSIPSSCAVFVTVPSNFMIRYGAVKMKLMKASTGHGDEPFRGIFGALPFCTFLSLRASAKAFLKAVDEGSKFESRSQKSILNVTVYHYFELLGELPDTYFL